MWRDYLLGLQQLVYPNLCFCCHELHADPTAPFCIDCLKQLTEDPTSTCHRCTSTVADSAEVEEGCPRCRDVHFAFESARRMNEYRPPLSDLILKVKNPGSDTLAECIAQVWANHMASAFHSLGIQLIVPVPLHWRRQLWRGFNISTFLAQQMAKKIKVPCLPNALRRIRSTPSQTSVSPNQRRENVRNAFIVRKPNQVKDKRILLVDDVLTTGSTVNEAAKALKKAGATSIHVGVIAHR